MFKHLVKPSKSPHTIIITSSLLKNQNRYLPHFKCPLKNFTKKKKKFKKYAINGLVGGIRRDVDVVKKEKVLSNQHCYCANAHATLTRL
jgi:hypothetical protein